MKYNELESKINNYLNQEKFLMDDEYISVEALTILLYRYLEAPFNLNNLTNNLNQELFLYRDFYYKGSFKKSFINKINLSMNKDFIILDLIFKRFGIKVDLVKLIKRRGNEIYLNEPSSYKESEMNFIADNLHSINDKVNVLESVSELLDCTHYIHSLEELDIFEGKSAFKYKNDIFDVSINLENEHFYSDLKLNELSNNSCRYYFEADRLDSLVNDNISYLKQTIKIPISILPEYVQKIVLFEKERNNVKKLEKKN